MNSAIQNYSLRINDRIVTVPQENAPRAAAVDKNHDHFVSAKEVRDFVRSAGDGEHGVGNMADLANEFKCSLGKVQNANLAGYHSFDSLIQDFDKLAEANPDFVQKTVLGKSPEGRDLVAYKISEGAQGDTSHRPGVVITGCHHAREWMTVEAPLVLAHSLLDGIDKDSVKQDRLKQAEVWIMPCVNPDGYEYTRSTDTMWRKNRRPLEVDQLGQPTKAIGVDLNRNYGDDKPGHEYIFRPESDKPGTTSDDFGATSDDPDSECYRGVTAGSEPEVKAVCALEVRPNVRAAIDYHSYGDDMLYPWSHTEDHAPNYELYQCIGAKVSQATGYKLEQSIGMYPNSGSSDEYQEANGIVSFTFEMGRSFQPNPKSIPKVAGTAAKGSVVFIDEIVQHFKAGTLPARA